VDWRGISTQKCLERKIEDEGGKRGNLDTQNLNEGRWLKTGVFRGKKPSSYQLQGMSLEEMIKYNSMFNLSPSLFVLKKGPQRGFIQAKWEQIYPKPPRRGGERGGETQVEEKWGVYRY